MEFNFNSHLQLIPLRNRVVDEQISQKSWLNWVLFLSNDNKKQMQKSQNGF